MPQVVSLTDIGKKRMMNQDYVYTSETQVGNLPNLFIVADGMGGYNGGGYASAYAVEVMRKVIENSKESNPRILFELAIMAANSEIRKKARESEELEGMGTTVVCACLLGNVLQVANVGDSRLYISGDEIRQITTDHSFVEEMIRVGGLDRESARNHPKKNIITRAIGADDNIEPDFFTVKLKKGEKVLMCSDGLSNMVTDDDICLILKGMLDLNGKAEQLIKAANDNGGKDNIAVIIIDPLQ